MHQFVKSEPTFQANPELLLRTFGQEIPESKLNENDMSLEKLDLYLSLARIITTSCVTDILTEHISPDQPTNTSRAIIEMTSRLSTLTPDATEDLNVMRAFHTERLLKAYQTSPISSEVSIDDLMMHTLYGSTDSQPFNQPIPLSITRMLASNFALFEDGNQHTQLDSSKKLYEHVKNIVRAELTRIPEQKMQRMTDIKNRLSPIQVDTSTSEQFNKSLKYQGKLVHATSMIALLNQIEPSDIKYSKTSGVIRLSQLPENQMSQYLKIQIEGLDLFKTPIPLNQVLEVLDPADFEGTLPPGLEKLRIEVQGRIGQDSELLYKTRSGLKDILDTALNNLEEQSSHATSFYDKYLKENKLNEWFQINKKKRKDFALKLPSNMFQAIKQLDSTQITPEQHLELKKMFEEYAANLPTKIEKTKQKLAIIAKFLESHQAVDTLIPGQEIIDALSTLKIPKEQWSSEIRQLFNDAGGNEASSQKQVKLFFLHKNIFTLPPEFLTPELRTLIKKYEDLHPKVGRQEILDIFSKITDDPDIDIMTNLSSQLLDRLSDKQPIQRELLYAAIGAGTSPKLDKLKEQYPLSISKESHYKIVMTLINEIVNHPNIPELIVDGQISKEMLIENILDTLELDIADLIKDNPANRDLDSKLSSGFSIAQIGALPRMFELPTNLSPAENVIIATHKFIQYKQIPDLDTFIQ